MKMLSGLLLFALVVTASVSYGRSPVYENFKPLARDAMVYSGNQLQIIVPGELIPIRVGPRGRIIRYEQRVPNVTAFIVRIGPASLGRECKLVTKNNNPDALHFTSVGSVQHARTPTMQDGQPYPSRDPWRRDWMNFKFSVDGGYGLPAQTINVVFARTSRPVQCYFDVLYMNTDNAMALRGTPEPAEEPGSAARSAPEAAPAEKREPMKIELGKELDLKAL